MIMYMYYPPPLSHVPLLAPALYPGLSTRARCPELVDIGRARRRVVVLYHHCAHACITGAAGRALLPSGRAAARGTPHTRTVWSSDADASMYGSRGFHATALTVPEWPGSTFCACKARQGEAARAKQSKAARAKQGKAARAKQGGARFGQDRLQAAHAVAVSGQSQASSATLGRSAM